jgi:hypothetical protein
VFCRCANASHRNKAFFIVNCLPHPSLIWRKLFCSYQLFGLDISPWFLWHSIFVPIISCFSIKTQNRALLLDRNHSPRNNEKLHLKPASLSGAYLWHHLSVSW